MNLLDAKVTRVLGEPREAHGRWWVPVEYDCWGQPGTTDIMCSTKEEALKVGIGYDFLT